MGCWQRDKSFSTFLVFNGMKDDLLHAVRLCGGGMQQFSLDLCHGDETGPEK